MIELKRKYLIGVPKFDATMCALRIGGDARQIGRRKAKDMIFQAVLDGDYIKLLDPIKIEGTSMEMIVVYDKDVYEAAISEFEAQANDHEDSL